jgi:hypothetical protein
VNPFQIQKIGDELSISSLYKNIYLFPYARYAFLEILEKLNIKSIYLPAFICRDMLSPINILNVKYHFYEVNEQLKPIIKDIKCDAIVMVNYFGFEQDINPFIKYKNNYNAIIIEDNAHGLLSQNKDEKLLGTRGDFGLLSIRKTIFLPNGGTLIVNNSLYKDIKFKSADIKKSDEDIRYFQKYNLKKKILSKYIGITIVLIRRLLRYIKTGDPIPLPDKDSEINLPANKYLTPLLEKQELNIDIEYEIKRRIEMYTNISIWAEQFNIKPIYELYDGVVPFEFAFIDNGRYKEFERYLYLKGFFILPWPDLPDEVVDKCPEFYKNVKVVPFLW